MPETAVPAHDMRVLIFAPVGRDADLTRDLLSRASIPCHVCPTIAALCTEFESGAGAILLTEEGLGERGLPDLVTALRAQPAWSEIPVLLFTAGDRSQALLRTLRLLEDLRNVTLLDRPVPIAAVVSTVRAALVGRTRQYELLDVLMALQAARDDAERANRLKDEFLATLSHELRTPLNAILGWVSMLRRAPIPAEQLPHIYDVIERNATAQAKLIADVLDVSRIVTGRLWLTRESIALPLFVATAVDSIRLAAKAKGIALRLEIDDSAGAVYGDRERLQQVLWNLLSNSVKFTPHGGRITVGVVRADNGVRIDVSDTGLGLAPDFLPFAFDRFRQADQSFTRVHGGLGLGLAIVKQIVELHGGRVEAESAGLGHGTTFRVFLPLEPVPSATTDSKLLPANALPEVDLTGRSILVVDDNACTRELLTEMLTHCHARVQTADSAVAALERVEHTPPALIIADIGIPGQDGLTMMATIRQLPADRGGALPAIALSAYARAEDRAAALGAGFTDFLIKPARPEEVLRVVQHLLH